MPLSFFAARETRAENRPENRHHFTPGHDNAKRRNEIQSPNWSSMMPSQICAQSMATFSLMNACCVPV